MSSILDQKALESSGHRVTGVDRIFFVNVAWSFEATDCNAIPHEAGSHQRSSLDPGLTVACHFLKNIFSSGEAT